MSLLRAFSVKLLFSTADSTESMGWATAVIEKRAVAMDSSVKRDVLCVILFLVSLYFGLQARCMR